MPIKLLMLIPILSLAALPAATSGATTFRLNAKGELAEPNEAIANVRTGRDANKQYTMEFDLTLAAADTCTFVITGLPPKNYCLHVDGWYYGINPIEKYAEGVAAYIPAGRHKIAIDKHGGGKGVDGKTIAVWMERLRYVKSSLDGTEQPCYFWAPEKAKTEAVPLVIGLHTWSGDYRQLGHYINVCKEAERRGWAFAGPNFRGPNSTPQACGSDFAVQDIVDAVDYAKAHWKIDASRVYIIGGSGGGHMTLLMLGRHPEVFAAGAAFCPITDCARWHADSLLDHPGRGKNYATMLEGACGGTPAEKPAEYAHRSPLTHLANAKAAGVPAYIVTGIHDGWKGSVPVGHSFRAFNALCEAGDAVSEADIAAIERDQKVPPALAYAGPDDPFYGPKMKIHFRRTSGNVRFTLFEGGHGGNFPAGYDFLSRQRKGAKVDWSIAADGKGCEEKLRK